MGSNLLRQISAERLLTPAGYYQFLALDLLTVVSAALTGFTYRRFLENGPITPLVAALLVFLLCSAFEVVLVKTFARRFAILVLQAAAMLSFFYDFHSTHPVLLAGAGAALLILPLWGELASRAERSNTLVVKFHKIIRPAVKKTITAVALAGALLYMSQWSGQNPLIPEPYFNAAFSWAAATAKNFYPEIEFNTTIDGLTKSIARYKLSGNRDFKMLPPAMQEQVLNEVVIQVEAMIRGYVGVPIASGDKVGGVLYRFVSNVIGEWQKKFGEWFAFAWTVIMFLALRSIGEFFWCAVSLISYGFYQLLLAVNMLRLKGEAAVRETVEFS